MSKPGAKKTIRQNRKRSQEQLRHRHQKAKRMFPPISPTFAGEQVGAPTAAAAWFGQKIASFIRGHKP